MEPKTSPDAPANSSASHRQIAQWLGGAGYLFFLLGAGPLGYFMFSNPELIIFADAGAIEFGAMRAYGAETEALWIAWAFFLAPISIICGAVFIAVSALIGALKG